MSAGFNPIRNFFVSERMIGILTVIFFLVLLLIRLYTIFLTENHYLESCNIVLRSCNGDLKSALHTLGSNQCRDAQICVNRGVVISTIDPLYQDFFGFINNLFKSWITLLFIAFIIYVVGTNLLNYFISSRANALYFIDKHREALHSSSSSYQISCGGGGEVMAPPPLSRSLVLRNGVAENGKYC